MRSQCSLYVVFVVFCALLSSCSGESNFDSLDEMDLPDEDAKADSVSELRVRAANTTLWVDKALVRRTEGDQQFLVLEGRTSRNLEDVFGFISDDAYGAGKVLSTRTFEVSWAMAEARSLLLGVNQFIRLRLKPSSGSPDTVFGRVVVRPRLSGFEGTGIFLVSEITPVVVSGVTRYRIQGTTAEKIYYRSAKLGDQYVSDIQQLDDTHIQVDLSEEELFKAAATNQQIVFKISLLNDQVEKKAKISLQVKKLGLTVDDPYQVWPGPSCTPQMQQCLLTLPKDSLNLGSCGDSLQVLACSSRVGSPIDNPDITAAIQNAENLVHDPAGFGGDAKVLVSSSRQEQFLQAVTTTVHERLVGLYGLWFLSAEAKQKAFSEATASVIDLAYALPLSFVEPLEPIPNDNDRCRNLAADAILEWAATHDLYTLEWTQHLVDLTRTHRQTHINNLRYFREEANPSDWSPNPDWYNYAGSWMSALFEVRIDKATGKMVDLYVEID